MSVSIDPPETLAAFRAGLGARWTFLSDAEHRYLEPLGLRDLEAQVDWGFAGDFAEAMVSMLEAERAQDFIIASGRLHRVRDFVEIAFAHVGLDWRRHVRQGAGVHQPVARAVYHGDITAIRAIGWAPRVSFEELVHQMVDAAVAAL